MALDKINLADLALTLEKSPDYRVLRRLVPRTEFIAGNEQPTKTGILLDVETTGLVTTRDEIIELGMVKFAYLPDGSVTRIIDVFESFNEPSSAIPKCPFHSLSADLVLIQTGDELDSGLFDHAVPIKPGLRSPSRESGNISASAGDFRRFRPERINIGPGNRGPIRRAQWRALLRVSGASPRVAD
jgi:hypothetical protein